MSSSAILFNSKTLQHSHLSNFFPFVKHRTVCDAQGAPLQRLTVRLRVPAPVRAALAAEGVALGAEVVCSSVEAAYQVAKYCMFMDARYAVEVLLPLSNVRVSDDAHAALAAKRAGGKGVYLAWKHARSAAGTTKRSLERAYEVQERRFHAGNLALMLELLWSKFSDNGPMRAALVGTGGAALHEVGKPSIWTRAGGDALGLLLQHVRAHLVAGTQAVEEVLSSLPPLAPLAGKRGVKRGRDEQ